MTEFHDLSAVVSRKVMVKPRLQVRYPKLSGLPDRKAEAKMNDRILSLVYGMIRDQGFVRDATMEMTGKFDVSLNGKGLVSIVFQNDACPKGEGSGVTVQKSLTMDAWDGRTYRFADLFRPDCDYKSVVDAILKRQIEEQETPDLEQIAFRGVGADQDYYLTPTQIVVYGPLLGDTPDASGITAFAIPYDQLADVADPNGPIGRLIRAAA
jgi:hypothetical protein